MPHYFFTLSRLLAAFNFQFSIFNFSAAFNFQFSFLTSSRLLVIFVNIFPTCDFCDFVNIFPLRLGGILFQFIYFAQELLYLRHNPLLLSKRGERDKHRAEMFIR